MESAWMWVISRLVKGWRWSAHQQGRIWGWQQKWFKDGFGVPVIIFSFFLGVIIGFNAESWIFISLQKRICFRNIKFEHVDNFLNLR
jgi:hypothetical protein